MTFNPAEKRDKAGRWTRLAGLLKSAGGFTHDLKANREKDSGFAVAIEGHEKVIPGLATAEDLKRYVAENKAALTKPKAHFGAWHDTQSGNTYLDASYLHRDMSEAMQNARENKQLAIYDLGGGKEVRTLDGDWQPNLDAMKGRDLDGLPSKPTAVPGHGSYTFHSNADLQRVASNYNREHGLGEHPTDYAPVDPEKGAKIAQAFEDMKHDPSNPEVAEAYAALKRETLAQYKALTDAGYGYDFYPEGGDPYANSPREAIYDLTHNHHMYVFPTLGADGGFGSLPANRQDHPLLEKVPGLQWGGQDVTYNDVFRAVHDSMAHAKEGVGFRARGEDNAYRQHYAMFSSAARKALASETRGQNSWLNFGPYGEKNRTANAANTVFADQKAGILPEWAIDPEYHKKVDNVTLSVITPMFDGEYDFAKADGGGLAFWKQILPKGTIHYTAHDGSRQTLNFTDEYLRDLASNKAVDKVPFMLADEANRHTMDPERQRGDVVAMEVREDGLYGKIVFPNADLAKAVLANPELGVSARIREGIQKSDGTTLSRGIIHVLGTLDPQVSGMAPWEATDLSQSGDAVLDLSNATYDTEGGADMARDTKKALEDYSEADLDAMTEDELDAFLAEFAPEFDGTLDEDEFDEDESENEDDDEDADQLVGAGADMSKVQKDIELANSRASYAEKKAQDALTRLAQTQWEADRQAYLAAGVPPHALDLAKPVLAQADDLVIDLSNTGGSDDTNASAIVRGLLDALKGTVDLSNERGHAGTFSEGEDPDAELLAVWESQA